MQIFELELDLENLALTRIFGLCQGFARALNLIQWFFCWLSIKFWKRNVNLEVQRNLDHFYSNLEIASLRDEDVVQLEVSEDDAQVLDGLKSWRELKSSDADGKRGERLAGTSTRRPQSKQLKCKVVWSRTPKACRTNLMFIVQLQT